MYPLLKCEMFQITDKNVIKTYLILLYLLMPPWKIRVYSNTIHKFHIFHILENRDH